MLLLLNILHFYPVLGVASAYLTIFQAGGIFCCKTR